MIPAVLLLGAAGYLLACTFRAPGTPILLGGDQAYFWGYADRLLHGERIYRDFFQFTPPGADLVYLAGFALFGSRVWVANAIVVGTGVALAWICFRAARTVVGAAPAALAAAAFTVTVYGKALNATHHWFSLLAILGAVVVLRPPARPARLALGGALIGLGAFFTQSHGAAALVAVLAFEILQGRRTRAGAAVIARRGLAIVLGFGAALAALSAYFVVTVGAGRLRAFQLDYVWGYAAHTGLGPSWGLAEVPTLRRLPWLAPFLAVYLLPPIAYGLVLARLWRRRWEAGSAADAMPLLLCLVGLSLFAEVALGGAGWLRVFAVAMPGFILAVWLAADGRRFRRRWSRVAWVGLVVLAAHHVHAMHRDYPLVLDLPVGRLATDAVHNERLSWLAGRTAPGDWLFAADWPGVHLPLGTRNPAFLDVVDSGPETRLADVERVLSELEVRRPSLALWPASLDALAAGSVEPTDAGARAFRGFLHEHYRLVHAFSDDERVWGRK